METLSILITGANKGIGFATVRAVLEREPQTFVFLASRDLDRGRAALAALVSENPDWAHRVEVVSLDVASDASVDTAAQIIESRLGRAPLYGIVNNAGIGRRGTSMDTVLQVNSWGPRRVCERLIPLLDPTRGRVVNVASASGPTFVSRCSLERQRAFTNPAVTWDTIEELMAECLALESTGGDFAAAGFGDGDAYGLSKAALNAYTLALARRFPQLTINACTPGFIETDMTRPYAAARGVSPREMGMRTPLEGTHSTVHLLLGEVGATGWYFGSDAQRSPLDRYRSPGDPPYSPKNGEI